MPGQLRNQQHILSNVTLPMVSQSYPELAFYDILSQVHQDFAGKRTRWLLVIFATVVAIGLFLWYVATAPGGYSASRILGTVIGVLGIFCFLLVATIFSDRLSDAMSVNRVDKKYVLLCIQHIEECKRIDQAVLDTIQIMAENDRNTLQLGTVLPNAVWAGAIAFLALWNAITLNIGFVALVSSMILLTATWYILSTERAQADAVIIQAVIALKARNKREQEMWLQGELSNAYNTKL